jgi:L-rhamnose isomerase / sugar isomerase
MSTLRLDAEAIAALEADRRDRHERALEAARSLLELQGVDADRLVAEVRRFSVAAPSWALGTGGTRFGRFPGAGEPRTVEEKLDDVAALNRLTGANRTVSLHVPWDEHDDIPGLREYAAALGLRFDAMNSNTFQDNPSTTGDGAITYKFGSLAAADDRVREAAVEHNLHVIEIGRLLGSTALSIWIPDGANHPGQTSLRRQFDRAAVSLRRIHDALPADWLLFTEHKPYEPAFYSTVVSDWGSSLLLAQAAGSQARCLVDVGHHLPNTNVEQVVSRLAMTGRLGGFHFNDTKYGDDDVTVGSIAPFRLFLVFLELLEIGDGAMPQLAYLIDQSNNLKDPIEDLAQATDAIQHTLALGLCVDRTSLAAAQEADDPALAAEILHAAFRADVRPLVAEARRLNGAALDPVTAYRRSGYRAAVTGERGSGHVATGL